MKDTGILLGNNGFIIERGFRMIIEIKYKKLICDIGKIVYEKGFVAANDGNISVRIDENEFLITPTGVSKGF
jgi:L-fuculose-phosphate aldolase